MLSDMRAAVALGVVEAADDRAAIDRLIERQVLLGEVARFRPPEPTATAVDELVAAMKGRAGAGLAELTASTGIDEARIRDLARDTLRIQAYVKQRFGVAATLADADVQRWVRDTRGRATVVVVE